MENKEVSKLKLDIDQIARVALSKKYKFTLWDIFQLGYLSGKYELKSLLENDEAVAKAVEAYDVQDDLGLNDSIGQMFIDLWLIEGLKAKKEEDGSVLSPFHKMISGSEIADGIMADQEGFAKIPKIELVDIELIFKAMVREAKNARRDTEGYKDLYANDDVKFLIDQARHKMTDIALDLVDVLQVKHKIVIEPNRWKLILALPLLGKMLREWFEKNEGSASCEDKTRYWLAKFIK